MTNDLSYGFDLCQLPEIAKIIREELELAGFKKETEQLRNVLKLNGETGEFTEAFARWVGEARRSGSFSEMEDEWSDVIITAFVVAIVLGIDPTVAIRRKLTTLFTRGWRDNATH